MPGNPGVNPSLTITALAEYAMSRMPEKVQLARLPLLAIQSHDQHAFVRKPQPSEHLYQASDPAEVGRQVSRSGHILEPEFLVEWSQSAAAGQVQRAWMGLQQVQDDRPRHALLAPLRQHCDRSQLERAVLCCLTCPQPTSRSFASTAMMNRRQSSPIGLICTAWIKRRMAGKSAWVAGRRVNRVRCHMRRVTCQVSRSSVA